MCQSTLNESNLYSYLGWIYNKPTPLKDATSHILTNMLNK